MRPFVPTIVLPEGVTVVEASAGTGKTYAVASIVVAEVARGRPLDEILLVTFTRKATGTLRDRVRRRLVEAVAGLAPGAEASTDPLIASLAFGEPEEVAARRANLATAVSDFDTATIATTHGFCSEVLASLGVAGDAERELELVEDVDAVVADAVDDLFVRRFFGGEKPILFTVAEARQLAKAVIANPDAELAPVDPGDTEDLRNRFAQGVRQRVVAQKRRSRIVTYDDLLARVEASLADGTRGPMVIERLRRRHKLVIVDEFQDTDDVQWRVFRDAFARPPCRLVLVGDPKQAIYAFRGGDVQAYLRATADTGEERTLALDISWRSDQPLLTAIDGFFGGAVLGAASGDEVGADAAIRHHPLTAREGADQVRLVGDGKPALTVRLLDIGRRQFLKTAEARPAIAVDVAEEAVRLLDGGLTIHETDLEGQAKDVRPLRPGDLAVLVRTHSGAEEVRAALRDAGVPAVVHGGVSVLQSDAALDWLDLLRALESPASTLRSHAAALGPFLGRSPTWVATAPEADWDDLDGRLHEWAAVLRLDGVAALLRRLEGDGLAARLLGMDGGPRKLADLRHVGELLHVRQASHPSSAASLATWLVEERAEGDLEAARRRLETDAGAVSILTIHAAKGLEFPVVLLPSVWDAPHVPDGDPPVFHDERGVRCIGVGSGGPRHHGYVSRAARERADEELRLLYVALTRARHRVVTWWTVGHDAGGSAFARILLGRDPVTGAVPDRLPARPKLDAVEDALRAVGVGVQVFQRRDFVLAHWSPTVVHEPLVRASFDRGLDPTWVRTSYSGLTADAHDARSRIDAAEVGEVARSDEPADSWLTPAPAWPPAPTAVSDATPSLTSPPTATLPLRSASAAVADPVGGPVGLPPVPLDTVPGGARIGTLVHSILEKTDFTVPDLGGALVAAADAEHAERLLPDHVPLLLGGLLTALRTPLGPLFGGRALVDLGRTDRRDELDFDLPLAGGDTPRASALTMDAIADVFAALPADDPLAAYHHDLRDPLLATSVRGFLTGSIDLVARIDGRYVIADYKTNRLSPSDVTLTSWHHRPDAMVDAMRHAHYPLQAALYSVALHRFLRWRLRGYDPSTHLGGVAYLFLRGMDGTPGAGVFSWSPPASFVTDLSDVLDRGTS